MAEMFQVLSGNLSLATSLPVSANGGVVLSNLSSGSAVSGARSAISIKYVASGIEIYRYLDRTFKVSEGQFLVVPEHLAGEVEVRSGDSSITWGLCLLLAPTATDVSHLEEPMIFPAQCSMLGQLLSASLLSMKNSIPTRKATAEFLLRNLANDLEPCLEDAVRILERIDAIKLSTRYETLRRLNRARAYLHSVTDRRVELGELAQISGISRFQLLRHYRDCFGEGPASYHRRIRLELARARIQKGTMTCTEAAHHFGFADASSLSHAHTRIFGYSPKAIRAAKAGCFQP